MKHVLIPLLAAGVWLAPQLRAADPTPEPDTPVEEIALAGGERLLDDALLSKKNAVALVADEPVTLNSIPLSAPPQRLILRGKGTYTLGSGSTVIARRMTLTLGDHIGRSGLGATDGLAVAEFRLMYRGSPAPWPQGMSWRQSAGDAYGSAPVEKLFNGNLEDKWYSWYNSGIAVTLWSRDNDYFRFDAYDLAISDQTARFPGSLTLSWTGGFRDGEDSQKNLGRGFKDNSNAFKWFSESIRSGEGWDVPFSVQGNCFDTGIPTMEVEGTLKSSADYAVEGRVVFAEGSTFLCDAPLKVTGDISGTVTVPLPADMPGKGVLLFESLVGSVEQLKINAPEGYRAQRIGRQWMLRKAFGSPLKAEIAADCRWSEMTWTDPEGQVMNADWSVLPAETELQLTVRGNAAVSTDVPHIAGRLSVTGAPEAGTPLPEVRLNPTVVRTNKVRLRLHTRAVPNVYNDGVALDEVRLMLNGETVPWNGASGFTPAGNVHDNGGGGALCDGQTLSSNGGDNRTRWLWYGYTERELGDSCYFDFTAAKGEYFIFDSFSLHSADVSRRNPTSWTLYAWSDTAGAWTTVSHVEISDDEATNQWKANSWYQAAAVTPMQLRLASLSADSVALTGFDITGTLTLGNDTVLKVLPDTVRRCTGVTGNALADLSKMPAPTAPVPLLTAPKNADTVLTLPEGWSLLYTDGAYRAAPYLPNLTADSVSGTGSWSRLDWKDPNGKPFVGFWDEPGSNAEATVNIAGDTTLTLDAPVALDRLTLDGSAAGETRPVLTLPTAVTADRIRLQLHTRVQYAARNEGVALGELRLTHGGEPQNLTGCRIGTPSDNIRFNGPNALIDGFLCSDEGKTDSTKWYWNNISSADLGNGCYFDIDTNGGDSFVFDGIGLASSDVNWRNPRSWSLFAWEAVRGRWLKIAYEAISHDEALAWKPNSWRTTPVRLLSVKTAVLRALVLSELNTSGNVVFEGGTVLKALPGKRGIDCSGAEGTLAVDASALTEKDFPFVLLRAPKSDRLTVTSDRGRVYYADGAYRLSPIDPEVTAELAGDTAWNALDWKTPDGTSVSLDTYAPALLKDLAYTLSGSGSVTLSGTSRNIRSLKLAEGTRVAFNDTDALLTVTDEVLIPRGSAVTATTAGIRVLGGFRTEGALNFTNTVDTYWLPPMKGSGRVTLIAAKEKPAAQWVLQDAQEPMLTVMGGRLYAYTAVLTFRQSVTLRDGAVIQLHQWNNSMQLGEKAVLTLCDGCGIDSKSGNNSALRPVAGGSIVIMNRDPANPAFLSGALYGKSYRVQSPISGIGRLVLRKTEGGGNNWFVDSVISDGRGGRLAVATDASYGNPYVALHGLNTFTGGLTVAGGTALGIGRPEAVGLGDITVEPNGELIAPAAGIVLRDGCALTLNGKLTGNLCLNPGSVLCTSAGTVTGNIVFADGTPDGSIVPQPDEGVAPGMMLIACANAATLDLRKFDTDALAAIGLGLAPNKEGTAIVIAEDPGADNPGLLPLPEGFETLPKDVCSRLVALLKDAPAPGQPLTGISRFVADTGSDATDATLADALALFTGIAAAAPDPDTPGSAVVTVSYVFGVTDMRPAVLQDTPCMVVTAAVRTVRNGTEQPAGFAPGTAAELLPEGPQPMAPAESAPRELTPEERTALFGAEAPTDGVRYLAVPAAGSGLFRVRVSK